jgi:hypothetical protein
MSTGTCALCAHVNPAEASFCNACGASLQLALCHGCEAINDRSASSCHKCGVAFPAAFTLADMGPTPTSTSVTPVTSSLAEEARARRNVKRALPATPVFVALVVVALGAAAYYAYLTDGIGRPESSTLPNALADAEPSHVAGVPQVVHNDERGPGSEVGTTDGVGGPALVPSGTGSGDPPAPPASAIATPEQEPVLDETSSEGQRAETLSPQAEAAPVTSGDDRRQRRRDGEDVGRPGVVSSSPPRTTMSPPVSRAPAPPARFEPPARCTDAIAALGLCDRSPLDKGH